MTDHSAPTRGEVTQGDIDRAAEYTSREFPEEIAALAEIMRDHRLAAIEETLAKAERHIRHKAQEWREAGAVDYPLAMDWAADAVRNLGRGV